MQYVGPIHRFRAGEVSTMDVWMYAKFPQNTWILQGMFQIICMHFFRPYLDSHIFLRFLYFHLKRKLQIKDASDKFNIIPQPFPKEFGIFIPLEVLVWVMTVCWVLHSRLIYFWRNMNISSIFYFSKSTSINTQYSSLWDTLKMMLFTKYLIKWKRIGKISWKFWCCLV